MRKPVHVIHCDRCEEEVKHAEVLAEGQKEVPAYYRLVGGAGQPEQEKKHDHLCERCTREVALLDESIFGNVRVHKTAEKNSEPEPTPRNQDREQRSRQCITR